MITKIFEIITNTSKAEKDIENLSSEVETLNTGLEKTNTEVGGLKKGGKAFDTLKKGAKGVAGGFKMMGTALKAAGIGLALAAFALLKELFEQNQKVVDAFNIAFETLSIAFNDFFNYISENVETISGFFKKLFDDPLESVKALGNAIKENIIERVKSALEVFGYLGKAMQKLFAGDFKGAIDEVKNAGTEFVDVLTGVDNSVEKATEIISDGVDALTEYTKSTYEQAKANVELKKKAELAAVANQGLIEKYDRQAEQQRQIRDDERKSIEERKKANDELGLILEKQEKAMLANAQISLRAAQAELKKDKNNIEFKKRVMEAENELAAVRATVTGFRSEQQTNEAALEKEGLELINSKLESEANLSIEQKRFNAEQIEDELKRLERLKEIDAEEKDLQLKRLQGVIDAANAGTQAKVDAEIAYNETKQQLEQQEVLRAKEIADAKAVISKQITDDELANDEKQKQSDKDKAQQKIDNQNAILDATNSALSSIGQIADAFAGDDEERAKKAFNINKGLGIAQAIISTSQGIMNAYTNPLDVASGVAFAKSIAIGLAGAAQIATIATTKFKPSGGGGSTAPTTNTEGGAATSPSQAPSFNVVGQSGFNQVAGALGQQQPVQAFVVSGDVTTAQQLQNNTIQQATF
tara:strand:- start:58 stop:1986 length:1929 start_codon:yes stop_codon:yes gene_type:complete